MSFCSYEVCRQCIHSQLQITLPTTLSNSSQLIGKLIKSCTVSISDEQKRTQSIGKHTDTALPSSAPPAAPAPAARAGFIPLPGGELLLGCSRSCRLTVGDVCRWENSPVRLVGELQVVKKIENLGLCACY